MTKKKEDIQLLDVRGMMRLLQYAMLGLGHTLKEKQQAILIRKEFGAGAVDGNEWSFNPNMVRPSENLDDMVKTHNEVLKFAKQVQAMLDHVKDIDTDIWAAGVREYFNSKK